MLFKTRIYRASFKQNKQNDDPKRLQLCDFTAYFNGAEKPIKPSSDRSVSFRENTGRPIYNTGRPVNLCRLVFYCTTRKCE